MPALSLAASAASSLGGSSCVASTVAVASVPPPSALVVADQPFVVGPGVSPVLPNLVSQIVVGKYVDLLPSNLQVKEPKPQLLFDDCLLRTHRHFSGHVWLAYDQAFNEHAVATQLKDWSCMNAQLFNFHAAGASIHSILLIGNRLVLREVLWFASLGTGDVALHLSPSAATGTAAPPVLVRIVQWFVQLCGLSILGRKEKGMLRPFSCKFLLGKKVSPH